MMYKNQPLVSVNILSFNRKDELRNTLTKVYEQDYKNIEVIVVDNASKDGSAEMIEREFPDVILIRLKRNIGIAGWNEGFKAAKGEYILVLDDDSYPIESAIQKAVNCISRDEEAGVAALKVYTDGEKRIETEYINKYNPNTFVGCAALILKSVFEKVGYFSKLLFIYEHEIEFSMRIINSGYKIIFCDNALVIHQSSKVNRIIRKKSDHRRKFYLCRNYVIILFLHFNLLKVALFIPQLLIARLLISIRERNFFTTVRGFVSGFIHIRTVFKSRMPLNKEVQKLYNFGNYMGRFVKDKSY